MQARTPSSTNVIIACCFASNSFRHFTKIKTKKLTKQNEKSGGKRTKRKKKKERRRINHCPATRCLSQKVSSLFSSSFVAPKADSVVVVHAVDKSVRVACVRENSLPVLANRFRRGDWVCRLRVAPEVRQPRWWKANTDVTASEALTDTGQTRASLTSPVTGIQPQGRVGPGQNNSDQNHTHVKWSDSPKLTEPPGKREFRLGSKRSNTQTYSRL